MMNKRMVIMPNIYIHTNSLFGNIAYLAVVSFENSTNVGAVGGRR